MAFERRANRLTRPGVPQPQGAIWAAGDQARAIGAESHAPDHALVAFERRADGLSGLGVPQPQRAVIAAGCQARAIGAESHASNARRLPALRGRRRGRDALQQAGVGKHRELQCALDLGVPGLDRVCRQKLQQPTFVASRTQALDHRRPFGSQPKHIGPQPGRLRHLPLLPGLEPEHHHRHHGGQQHDHHPRQPVAQTLEPRRRSLGLLALPALVGCPRFGLLACQFLCGLPLPGQPLVARFAHHWHQPVVDQFDSRGVGLLFHPQQARFVGQPGQRAGVDPPFGQCIVARVAAAKARALDQMLLDELGHAVGQTGQRIAVEGVEDVVAGAGEQLVVDQPTFRAAAVQLGAAQAQQHRLDRGRASTRSTLVVGAAGDKIDDARRHAGRQHLRAHRLQRLNGFGACHRQQPQPVAQQRRHAVFPAFDLGQKIFAQRQHDAATPGIEVEL